MESLLHEELKQLLECQKFKEAEQKAKVSIEEGNLQFQTWVYYAEALAIQGYIKDAYEIIQRVRLFDPMGTWIDARLAELKAKFKQSKPMKTNFKKLINVQDVTVAVAMIVKNDLENTKRWYNSIGKAADEIVIVDTGSTDGTLEYIQTLKDVKVVEYAWDDSFAAARNAALPVIESDWVLWMDSDEYLDSIEQELDSIRYVAGYYEQLEERPVMKIVQVNIVEGKASPYYDQTRMFSTRDNLHYTGRIHEQVVPVESDMYSAIPRANSGIRLIHDGYEKHIMVDKNKLERNLKLLKLGAEEEPHNPFWWSYLGRESRMLGYINEALEYLHKAEETAQAQPKFGRLLETYDNMMIIYSERQDKGKIDEIINKMLAIDPDYPNAHYLFNMRNLEKAIDHLNQAMIGTDIIKDTFTRYRGNVSADPAILEWRADLLKADVLKFMGNLADAKALYEQIHAQYPNDGIVGQLNYIEEQRNRLNGGQVTSVVEASSFSLANEESVEETGHSTVEAVDPTKIILKNSHVLKAQFDVKEDHIAAVVEVNSRTKDKQAQNVAEKYGSVILEQYPYYTIQVDVIKNKAFLMNVQLQPN